MSGNQQILANLIRARAATEPDLDVLTFVDVAADGSLVDEVRTYAQLWQNGQRIARSPEGARHEGGRYLRDGDGQPCRVRRPDGGLVHPRDDLRADRSAHAGRQARLHAGFRGMQGRGGRRRRARGSPRGLGRACGPLDPAAERRPRGRRVHAPDPGRRPARACARGRKLGPRSHDADPVHVGDDRRPEGHPHHPRQVHDRQHCRRDPRAHPRGSSVHRACR